MGDGAGSVLTQSGRVSAVKDMYGKKRPKVTVTTQSPPPGRMNRKKSFVMTLWLEDTADVEEPQWRWRVVDVQENTQVHFLRLNDVLAYVSEQTGAPPPC